MSTRKRKPFSVYEHFPFFAQQRLQKLEALKQQLLELNSRLKMEMCALRELSGNPIDPTEDLFNNPNSPSQELEFVEDELQVPASDPSPDPPAPMDQTEQTSTQTTQPVSSSEGDLPKESQLVSQQYPNHQEQNPQPEAANFPIIIDITDQAISLTPGLHGSLEPNAFLNYASDLLGLPPGSFAPQNTIICPENLRASLSVAPGTSTSHLPSSSQSSAESTDLVMESPGSPSLKERPSRSRSKSPTPSPVSPRDRLGRYTTPESPTSIAPEHEEEEEESPAPSSSGDKAEEPLPRKTAAATTNTNNASSRSSKTSSSLLMYGAVAIVKDNWLVISFLLAALVAVLFRGNLGEVVAEKELQALRGHFPTQNQRLWSVLKDALTAQSRALEPDADQPTILVLTPTRGGASRYKEFLRKFEESLARLHGQSSCSIVDVSSGAFRGATPEEMKRVLHSKLTVTYEKTKSRCFHLIGIDHLPGEAALLLHGICDTNSSPLRRSFILLSIDRPPSVLPGISDRELEKRLRQHLRTLWKAELGTDEVYALLNRVAGRIGVFYVDDE